MGSLFEAGLQDSMFSLACLSLLLARFSLVQGHTRGTNVIAYFDAYLPQGNYCGARRPITGWVATVDRFRDDVGTGKNVDFVYFNTGTGTYTTPDAGVYHCCATFRCKQGGVCDFTVIRNAGAGDNVWGAFGARGTGHSGHQWESHSMCVISRVGANPVTWKVNMES